MNRLLAMFVIGLFAIGLMPIAGAQISDNSNITDEENETDSNITTGIQDDENRIRTSENNEMNNDSEVIILKADESTDNEDESNVTKVLLNVTQAEFMLATLNQSAGNWSNETGSDSGEKSVTLVFLEDDTSRATVATRTLITDNETNQRTQDDEDENTSETRTGTVTSRTTRTSSSDDVYWKVLVEDANASRGSAASNVTEEYYENIDEAQDEDAISITLGEEQVTSAAQALNRALESNESGNVSIILFDQSWGEVMGESISGTVPAGSGNGSFNGEDESVSTGVRDDNETVRTTNTTVRVTRQSDLEERTTGNVESAIIVIDKGEGTTERDDVEDESNVTTGNITGNASDNATVNRTGTVTTGNRTSVNRTVGNGSVGIDDNLTDNRTTNRTGVSNATRNGTNGTNGSGITIVQPGGTGSGNQSGAEDVQVTQNGYGIMDSDVQAKSNIRVEKQQTGQGATLVAELSNGQQEEIRVMPSEAAEIAIQAVGTNSASTENMNVVLRQVGSGDNARAVYVVKVPSEKKFLGIFQSTSKVRVDATTGEIVNSNNVNTGNTAGDNNSGIARQSDSSNRQPIFNSE